METSWAPAETRAASAVVRASESCIIEVGSIGLFGLVFLSLRARVQGSERNGTSEWLRRERLYGKGMSVSFPWQES